jgi:hypothetical protein
MASYPSPRGPAPKPESKRRRYAKPKSLGAAEPTTAPAVETTTPRELGIDNARPFAAALWETVQQSCEAAFYSEADWVRLRLELFYANTLLAGRRQLTPSAWSAFQSGDERNAVVARGQTPCRDRAANHLPSMSMRRPRCRWPESIGRR